MSFPLRVCSVHEVLVESLIDACAMEGYFRDHMAARDLCFLDKVASALSGYDPEVSEAQQRSFLEQFVHTHNAPSASLRQGLPCYRQYHESRPIHPRAAQPQDPCAPSFRTHVSPARDVRPGAGKTASQAGPASRARGHPNR
jgi:hypothetical protein